jgi:hypothetical protein
MPERSLSQYARAEEEDCGTYSRTPSCRYHGRFGDMQTRFITAGTRDTCGTDANSAHLQTFVC